MPSNCTQSACSCLPPTGFFCQNDRKLLSNREDILESCHRERRHPGNLGSSQFAVRLPLPQRPAAVRWPRRFERSKRKLTIVYPAKQLAVSGIRRTTNQSVKCALPTSASHVRTIRSAREFAGAMTAATSAVVRRRYTDAAAWSASRESTRSVSIHYDELLRGVGRRFGRPERAMRIRPSPSSIGRSSAIRRTATPNHAQRRFAVFERNAGYWSRKFLGENRRVRCD